jgi:hypothetical protein
MEEGLSRWLDGFGVSVRIPLKYESSEADYPARTILLSPQHGTEALFHEASHIWLAFFGFSPAHIETLPSGRGRDRALQYQEFNRQLDRVMRLESSLPGAERYELRKILGMEEIYPSITPAGADRFVGVYRASLIGNLIDETRTLGRPVREGHPMGNYHEFFASSMSSLAFDGDQFFSALRKFRQSLEDRPRLRELFDATLQLLDRTRSIGLGFSQDLARANVPGVERLAANLETLGRFIEESRAARRTTLP